MNRYQTKTKSRINNPVILGWITLLMAICLTVLAGWEGPFGFRISLLIAGPLLLVCFCLAFVAMFKDQVAGGTILMIATFALPPLAFLIGFIIF